MSAIRGARDDACAVVVRSEHYEPDVERLSKPDLHALQVAQVRADVERALQGNAFYRPRYLAAGVRPDRIQSLDDLARIPIVRKDEIVQDIAAHPPYGWRLQVPEHEIVNVVETSGTSGRGTEVQALTWSDWTRIVRAEAFGFFWAGVRQGTVVAINTPVSMTAAGVWWLGALERLRANPLRLGGGLSTEQRLATMKRYGVELFTASAAYLLRLEHAAAEVGYELPGAFPRLRSIFCGGGGWSARWAVERARRWNARLFEQYGSSQRAIGWTCEQGILREGRPGIIHGLPHLWILEVLDPSSGEPVKPGQEGEIVITPLGQEATPLIRYATGDRGRFMLGEECSCGRAFDGIQASSVARYDDMIKIRGLNVWPDAVSRVVFDQAEVAEYRGDVWVDERGAEVVRLHVELRSGVNADRRRVLLPELAAEVLRRTGLRVTVIEWDGPSLLTGQAGGLDAHTLKIRRWTDRRAASLADP
jgi:phenylacetate-CoA ligase